jgi:transposase
MHYIQGVPRNQLVMFNDHLDQMIPENHPVRFIDAYIDTLDLEKLGFTIPKLRTGKPPYNPALLLKIYVYCYFEKIRSSRKIENECSRNQELIWLTCRLKPDFKTIADFRKNNKNGITNVFKAFLLFCNELNLLSLENVAIDGTKVRAQNSLNEVYNRETIDDVKEKIGEKIITYLKVLEENDQKEEEDLKLNKEEIQKVLDRIKKLEKREEKVDYIKSLFDADESLKKYFATDPTSTFQSDKGKVRPGFNPQAGSEDKNKLIVVNDVTNESNDLKQMTPMIDKLEETKNELGIREKTNAIFDSGYDSENEILRNKDREKIEVLVSDKKEAEKKNEKKRGRKTKKKQLPAEGFEASNFEYDEENDIYTCPEGKKLKKQGGIKKDKNDRDVFVYQCKGCEDCQNREKCTNSKKGRMIKVSAHKEEIESYKESMKTDENKKILSKRKELIEHPFGTIKRSLGFTYFMQRSIEKVKAEFSFICFIYNLKRVLNILSVKDLIKVVQKG